jgi:DNA-binding NarL/FixJ family response regulator
MPIKIAITDDHQLVVEGIKNTFYGSPDFKIVGTFSNAAEVFQGLEKTLPDILLLDLQLPDISGYELVPLLLKQYPELKILILSGVESSRHIKEMMQKGCSGYLFKTTTNMDVLVDAVRRVYNGEIYLNADLKEQLLNEMLNTQKARLKIEPKITEREKDILKLIAEECSSQQIAEKLFISTRTVETHRHNLLQKLNIKNTAGLVKVALEMGL